MKQAFRTFGRVVAAHWPALMAWYLSGEVVHRLLLQLAGTVGGYTTLGGLLILPLAVAARMVSYVAMYLAVRPSLPHAASDGLSRRDFAHAVLVSILPFFAFYEAWGMLDADRDAFLRIANAIAFAESGYGTEALGDRGGMIAAGPLAVTVLVIALVLRIVLARHEARLGTGLRLVAVYAEVLWTFMLFTLVAQWWGGVREWLSHRTGADWLRGIGDWFAAHLPPIAGLWEGASWALGIVIAAIVVPAAWLIVVGVIYGTSFETETKLGRWSGRTMRGTVRSIARPVIMRLESLWAAAAVIWRGGPALFGATALAYALWILLDRVGGRAVLELIGGQDETFWEAYLPLILVGVAAIAEPLRVALLATCYDVVIARPSAGLDSGSGFDEEPRGPVVLAGDVEVERPVGIGREGEHGDDVVRG
ncbi:hypothetical protein [Microbacterium nymphoidis]|uniref:hypothetical protein n=1 Tax=Microbacterium nymphoidis TaxID=2898586 RepID=UPI001E476546|nr:hypothetical protein [Microbacterium nymphoidis]MCD2498112.1 hypothetical protein [Microbacterium nymphoidis]